MKSIFFLILCSLAFCCCTINAQPVPPKKPQTVFAPASCLTAAPVCETKLASNILMNENSFMGCFENHTVIYGRTWGCFTIYEDDEMIFFGDGDAFWLDNHTYCMKGGDFKVSVNLSVGTGIIEQEGRPNIEMRKATYNGECSRSDFQIVAGGRAN